jgi:hypothetical protein
VSSQLLISRILRVSLAFLIAVVITSVVLVVNAIIIAIVSPISMYMISFRLVLVILYDSVPTIGIAPMIMPSSVGYPVAIRSPSP